MLSKRNFPKEKLRGNRWRECLEDDLPDAGHDNYRIALRKYDQFLGWKRT